MATPRKGKYAPKWIARYLRPWWPNVEAVTIGVRGSDLIGTPGVAWEIKASNEFKPTGFVAQAKNHAGSAALPVVVYVPNGCGEQNIEFALGILPLHLLIGLLDDAGYTDRAARADRAKTAAEAS